MPSLNVTVPVYNEEATLNSSITRLASFLAGSGFASYEIVIAENASRDRTLKIANRLSDKIDGVRVVQLAEKGRGRALKKAWSESDAEILSYMDVDLSTDLACLPALIEPIARGATDLAVGSRLLSPRMVTRGPKREFISRCYNFLIRFFLKTRFSDAQCGFKAVSRSAVRELLPLVEDNGWFFDSELLIIAEKMGFRIFDLPVRWVDDPDTRVKIVSTAFYDICGLMRVRRNWRQGLYKTESRLTVSFRE